MKKRKKWLGIAKTVKSSRRAPMAKNTKRRAITLHNEGVDRPHGDGSPVAVAEYTRREAVEYHATWNVNTGQWAQLLPFDCAARSLLNAGLDGGIGCNRSGTVNIQICVVGYGHKSFTRGKLKNAWVLADLADSWDIPWKARKRWPGSRSVKAWRKSGIHGHCHAPGNDHTDPGGIDIDKLMREARRQQKARRGRR